MVVPKSVPFRFVILGVVLGLLFGGLAVDIFNNMANRQPPTASSTISLSDSTNQPASSVTTTVTSTVTERQSTAPSMTLEPTLLLYYPGQDVVLLGTLNPPPQSDQGIELTTTNPLGTVVQVGTAETGSAAGTFFFILNTDTSSAWVSGKYSVTAQSGKSSATANFYYAASQFGTNQLGLQVVAPGAASPGQQIGIGILSTLQNGTLDEVTSWSTVSVYFPDGTIHPLCTPASTVDCSGAFSRVHIGLYQISFQVPSPAPGGTYFIEVAAGDASGDASQGLAEFSVP